MYIFVYKSVGQQIKHAVICSAGKFNKVFGIWLVLQKRTAVLQCVVKRAVVSAAGKIAYDGLCIFVVFRAFIQVFDKSSVSSERISSSLVSSAIENRGSSPSLSKF